MIVNPVQNNLVNLGLVNVGREDFARIFGKAIKPFFTNQQKCSLFVLPDKNTEDVFSKTLHEFNSKAAKESKPQIKFLHTMVDKDYSYQNVTKTSLSEDGSITFSGVVDSWINSVTKLLGL